MGSGDLLDEIVNRLPESDATLPDALRVAVVGRPNVGKSSFVNRLLGEERLVVSDVAGTTRDSIDTPFRYHGRDLIFVDTAGCVASPRWTTAWSSTLRCAPAGRSTAPTSASCSSTRRSASRIRTSRSPRSRGTRAAR
jgi:GTPase Era involved in 16S rRNA processing